MRQLSTKWPNCYLNLISILFQYGAHHTNPQLYLLVPQASRQMVSKADNSTLWASAGLLRRTNRSSQNIGCRYVSSSDIRCPDLHQPLSSYILYWILGNFFIPLCGYILLSEWMITMNKDYSDTSYCFSLTNFQWLWNWIWHFTKISSPVWKLNFRKEYQESWQTLDFVEHFIRSNWRQLFKRWSRSIQCFTGH